VSQPAVSYAYNRPEQLSAEVRERILRVASDLNYPGPNPWGGDCDAGLSARSAS